MIGRIDAGNAVELFRLLGPDLQIHYVEQVRGAILVEDRTLHIHDEGEPFPVGSMAESSVGLVTGRMFPGKIRPDLELVQDLPGEPVGLGRSKKDIPAAVVGNVSQQGAGPAPPTGRNTMAGRRASPVWYNRKKKGGLP